MRVLMISLLSSIWEFDCVLKDKEDSSCPTSLDAEDRTHKVRNFLRIFLSLREPS